MIAGAVNGSRDLMAEDVSENTGQRNEALIYFVSWMATVFTIGLFSSGLLICWKIYRSRSVGSVSHIPFVAASINCALWMTYGLIKPDTPVTYINAIGLLLQLSYILVYHTYTEIKYKIQRDFIIAVVIVLSIILYFSYAISDHMTITRQLGLTCNVFTILFFGSPLVTMTEVVRSKSTETMSFVLTIMSVFTALSWVMYGTLVSDIYIIFPNAVGLILSLIQLSLFLMYGQKSPRPHIPIDLPIV